MANLDENKVSADSKDILADVLAEEKKKKAEKADESSKKDDKPKKEKKHKGESGAAKKFKHGAMATTLTVIFFVPNAKNDE